jgi:hypothetical protein
MPSSRHKSDLGFPDAKFKREPRQPANVRAVLYGSKYGSIVAADKKHSNFRICPITLA